MFDSARLLGLTLGMCYLSRFLRRFAESLRPCVLWGACCMANIAFALPSRNEAVIAEATGLVTVAGPGGVAVDVAPGLRLKPRSKVRVGSGGRLVVVLSNGSRLLVEGSATFDWRIFSESEAGGSVVELQPRSGLFTVALPRQGPLDTFAFNAEQGLVYLRSAGLYQFSVQGEESRAACLAGEVQFVPTDRRLAPHRLSVGQQLALSQQGQTLATSIRPLDAQSRRTIIERLAFEREFKVYPLEQGSAGTPSSGRSSSTSLEALMARIEDIVERQTQLNPSPTGG